MPPHGLSTSICIISWCVVATWIVVVCISFRVKGFVVGTAVALVGGALAGGSAYAYVAGPRSAALPLLFTSELVEALWIWLLVRWRLINGRRR
jgi:hypothetical protein